MLCYANTDAHAHVNANANAEDVKCNALSAISAMLMPRSCLSMLCYATLYYTTAKVLPQEHAVKNKAPWGQPTGSWEEEQQAS